MSDESDRSADTGKTNITHLPLDVLRLVFEFCEGSNSLTATNRYFYNVRRHLYLRLSRKYSLEYYKDENFRTLVRSRVENPSKQLSLTLTTLSNYTGKGVYTPWSGAKYDGDYVDGKMHGKGVMTWPDGRKYRSEWQYGSHTGLHYNLS